MKKKKDYARLIITVKKNNGRTMASHEMSGNISAFEAYELVSAATWKLGLAAKHIIEKFNNFHDEDIK